MTPLHEMDLFEGLVSIHQVVPNVKVRNEVSFTDGEGRSCGMPFSAAETNARSEVLYLPHGLVSLVYRGDGIRAGLPGVSGRIHERERDPETRQSESPSRNFATFFGHEKRLHGARRHRDFILQNRSTPKTSAACLVRRTLQDLFHCPGVTFAISPKAFSLRGLRFPRPPLTTLCRASCPSVCHGHSRACIP